MAVQWVEGFDHVNNTTPLAAKGWTFVTPGLGSVSVNSGGRINGQYLGLTRASGQNASTATKNLTTSATTLVFGFAFKYGTLPLSISPLVILRAGTTAVCNVNLTTGGSLNITNNGGTSIATGSTSLNTAQWYYVEVKLVVNGASGSVTVHLNGSAEIASTAGNFGSTAIDNVQITSTGALITEVGYDDLYVLDTTGSVNTGFLGDVHVETLLPSADGAHTQWTPDTGTDHYSRVNEDSGTYPDGDTSYVSDRTVGHRDSYTYSDLTPLTGSVFAVQTNLYARKDDAGTSQIAPVVRRSATDYDGTTVTLSTSYSYYSEVRETDPSTSAAWTISGVNSAEFGLKTVA